MKDFIGQASNDKFTVGCTGQTVYVYDNLGNELAKFKDLIYAYKPAISPKGDIFIVKSNVGRLAVYSLETLSLIKKFRFSKVEGCQDDGFCFSKDSSRFFNIERHKDDLKTALSIYRTEDFSLEKRLFSDETDMCLETIENSLETDEYFLLGYYRNSDGIASKFFVAKLFNDELSDTQYISDNEYEYYSEYKSLELYGFTKEATEWMGIKHFCRESGDTEIPKHSLAKLWEYYKRGS